MEFAGLVARAAEDLRYRVGVQLAPVGRDAAHRKSARIDRRLETLEEGLYVRFRGAAVEDEIYDGPFCILFIVDNRRFRRLAYEGGDIVTGAATVIEAMGAGKRAAAAIDAYLKGKR